MYYVAEVNGVGVFAKADPINAKSLSHAKRLASKSQVFQGTEVNDNGFILNPIACKKQGKWIDIE